MLDRISYAIEKIKEVGKNKPLKVISHFDTDGITSAAIFSRALFRSGISFSLEIVKSLEENYIDSLNEDNCLIFLDLASGSLPSLGRKNTEIFIFDHHEVIEEVPDNVVMVNPYLHGEEPISSAAICYLFAKALSVENKDLATLAVIGMVGDLHEKTIGKIFEDILRDSETTIKKGLMLYPSTRPLDRALEYSSSPYIPGVTGSYTGVLELLKDAGIEKTNGSYKALYELSDEEMSRLITTVMLRSAREDKPTSDDVVGNLFLVRFFSKLEDSRELSALINACSRMGSPEVALGFCLGNKSSKEEAEQIYIQYKQRLVSALKFANESEKISGNGYMILNAQDQIKDTIIGTVASIISHSPLYPEGMVVVALAYNEDKIKVSARLSGRKGRNVRDVLTKAIVPLGGEVGGHPAAAGCLISKEQETEFIGELKKVLDVELVKM